MIALISNVYPKFSVDFSWSMMTLKIIQKPRNIKKNDVSGTGRATVITSLSNEMGNTFLLAMDEMRSK